MMTPDAVQDNSNNNNNNNNDSAFSKPPQDILLYFASWIKSPNDTKNMRLLCRWWQQNIPSASWELLYKENFPFKYEEYIARREYIKEHHPKINKIDKIDWKDEYSKAHREEYVLVHEKLKLTEDQIKIFQIMKAGDKEAIQKDIKKIHKIFLDIIANENVVRDSNSYTYLDWLVINDHKHIMNYIYDYISKDENLNIRTKIIFAIALGQIDEVKKICETDIGSDTFFDGLNSLHLAARYGQYEIVEYLVQVRQFNVNIETRFGEHAVTFTPIQYAAAKGYERIVKFLLEHGAAIKDLERYYHKAYYYHKMMRVLLEHKFMQNNKYELLPSAVENKNFQTVKLLLEGGTDPNTTDRDGYTALHLAVNEEDFEIALLLCDHNAEINKQTVYDGIAPLHIAAEKKNIQVTKLLIERGAKLEIFGIGRTVLHIAIENNNVEQVKVLIEAGANVNAIASVINNTSLVLAISKESVDCTKYLLQAGASFDYKNKLDVFFEAFDILSYIKGDIKKLVVFEKEFRAMLKLITNMPLKVSFLSNLLSELGINKIDFLEQLSVRLKYFTEPSNLEVFEERLLAFFQNRKEWLELDNNKFKKFCEIVKKFTKNLEIIKFANEYASEGLAKDQKSSVPEVTLELSK